MPSNDKRCVNCGIELRGDYCHACGQRKIRKEDKSLKHFFEEAFASLFYADGKFPKTLRLLVTKPGALTAAYIKGIRRTYVSPLQLFFFANLIYFLFPVLSTFNTSLYIQMNSLPYSPMVERTVNGYLEESNIPMEDFRADYEQKSASVGKLMLILLVLLQGLMLQLLFLPRKEYYLQDFFAAAAYFNSFYILLILVLLPFTLIGIANLAGSSIESFISESILTVVFLGVILIYMSLLIRRAFSTTIAGALWRGTTLAIFMIPSFMIYRFILFWITYLAVT